MNSAETELEARLEALPDVYPDFVRLSMMSIKERGLADEVLGMLNENPDATTESVLEFESVYCGDIEVYDDDGARVPVGVSRLRLTSGMRGILAEMKGKTFKSYEYESIGGAGEAADSNVRISLGQHAVDLNCCGFVFDLSGAIASLGALHCERMSLLDDFRAWSDGPVCSCLVGERVTDVELFTDHVEASPDEGALAFDVDVAVTVRTAHGAYMFARKSWESTEIAICENDGAEALEAADARNAKWLEAHPNLGAVKVTRSADKLA